MPTLPLSFIVIRTKTAASLSFLPMAINHKAQLTSFQTSFDFPSRERIQRPAGIWIEIKSSKFSFLSETRYDKVTSAISTTLTLAMANATCARRMQKRELRFVIRLQVITSAGTPVTRECLSTAHRLFTRERRGPLRSHIPILLQIT